MNGVVDLSIQSLGSCRIQSPLVNASGGSFVSDHDRILYDDVVCDENRDLPVSQWPSFEAAGARREIFFDPSNTVAGIVTCGGLCPGLNDVIRAIVLSLWYNYGVRRILGFRNGYQGLNPDYGHEILSLDPEAVDGWQDLGGTKLGSSRGNQDPARIVDTLVAQNVNILFAIGGDGTMRGAQTILEEVTKRKLNIAVVGVPKTIDNDILFIDESFGFQSAYMAAVDALKAAHVEAKGAPNGVGLVKLMGRDSGFIAAHAALSMSDVNFVLIPEVPFKLEGQGQFLQALERRLKKRHHAVVVVAEGAGQDLVAGDDGKDASGNAKLKDIGVFLKEKITAYFKTIGFESSVKYIDPSYLIRSVPANAYDSVYCLQLGHDAAHAAMAGKTGMLVGRWHGKQVHVPIALVTTGRKRIDPSGALWRLVLESTGQEAWETPAE